MLFFLVLRSRWEGKRTRQVVVMVSSLSSVRVNRTFLIYFTLQCGLIILYSAAEVTIHIKNQGSEAYRHEDYGDSIVITRRFTKDGSASWKIKSADDRLISSKKDEVAAISDHMSIQVSVSLHL